VVFLGVLSYSLYLWQQLFLDRHSTSALTSFPVNVGAALVAAAVSYHIIERPALRLKTALAKRSRAAASFPRQSDSPGAMAAPPRL
jgi:peptidoglycan/LPS O-acetylase OafA/YrhL